MNCNNDKIDFSELHKAYLDARKHKRNTINQLKFERSLEAELLSLCGELENRTYELRPGVAGQARGHCLA